MPHLEVYCHLKGYQIGSIAGGVVTGGVDDFVMSGRKFAAGGAKLAGGVTGAAAWHATKRVGVEGGFTVAGGAIGYANGGMDGLLLGAGIGQSVGSIVGNLTVACFRADTPILVSKEGDARRADAIRQGDFVAARNEYDANAPVELKRVEEVFVRISPVIELVARDKIIGTTPEHPFYVVERQQFIPARHLEIGEHFLSDDGQEIELTAVRDTKKTETVYNFRVADFHTYFVGGKGWGFSVWVHNTYDPKLKAAVDELELDPASPSTVARIRGVGQIGVSSNATSLSRDISNLQLPHSVRASVTSQLKSSVSSLGNIDKETLQAIGHAEFASLYLARANGIALPPRVKLDTNRIMCAGPAGNCRQVLGHTLNDLGIQQLLTRDHFGNVIEQSAGGAYRSLGKMSLDEWMHSKQCMCLKYHGAFNCFSAARRRFCDWN